MASIAVAHIPICPVLTKRNILGKTREPLERHGSVYRRGACEIHCDDLDISYHSRKSDHASKYT
jgi:hypothetical protein